MAQTEYNRDTGHLPGNEPSGAEPTEFEHDYFGGPSETKFSGKSKSGVSEADNYAATGYPPDLSLPENDAGGQVQR